MSERDSEKSVAEQLIFGSSMEGLLDGVRNQLTPKCRERILKECGVDVDAKTQPGCSAKVWARCIQILGEELFPALEPTMAHRELGVRTIEAFVDGHALGRAIFGVLRLLGPDRTVGRMTKNLRTGSSFVETRFLQLAPQNYEILINDVSGVPGFYQGMLERGLYHVGAKTTVAAIDKYDGCACTFLVRWTSGKLN
jgi:uncharacterized protein (TIGR02265 family)